MELRQIRSFVAASEFASMSRAATAMFISQPALSRQIQSLERELGVRLFYREARRLSLTDAGELFLERMRSLLKELEQTRLLMEEVKQGTGGVLRIAVPPIALRYVVLPALATFRELAPAVDVQIVEADYGVVPSLLEGQEVHLGLTTPLPGMEDLSWEEMYTAGVYALVPPLHPWATKEYVTLQDLTHERLLLLSGGRPPQLLFEITYQVSGFQPRLVFESHNIETLLMLAESRFGVTLMTDTVPFNQYRLRAIPLVHNGKQLQAKLIVAWHSRRPLSEASKKFIDVLRSQVAHRKTEGYTPWRPAPVNVSQQ